jgi:hypothetical protein
VQSPEHHLLLDFSSTRRPLPFPLLRPSLSGIPCACHAHAVAIRPPPSCRRGELQSKCPTPVFAGASEPLGLTHTLGLTVGRPTPTSSTPSATTRRSPPTPSCLFPLLPPPPATNLAGIDGQSCAPALTPAKGHIASILILLGSFMQSFNPSLSFKSVNFKNA